MPQPRPSSRRPHVAALGLALLISTRHAASAPDDFFSEPPSVVSVRVTLAQEAIASLSEHPRDYVKGAAAVAGAVPSSVHVRLRGNGSFRPITDKPNLAIKFKEIDRRKLLLGSSAQDPTKLRWKLASEMFLKAGLPAARIGFARVELNGRNLGLYVCVEPTDQAFLRHHFGSTTGSLFEGSNNDVADPLELDSGPAPIDRNVLQPLADACQGPDPERRWKLFEATLDVDRFASFMAMEVLVCHHDGYSLDRNNFRIYQDPASHRFVFIPHGMDLIFDRPSAPLVGHWRGLVAHAFMGTSEGRKRYAAAVARLVNTVYADDAWPRRIDEWAKVLRPEVGSGGDPERWEAAVADLKRVVEERRAFATQALAQLE